MELRWDRLTSKVTCTFVVDIDGKPFTLVKDREEVDGNWEWRLTLQIDGRDLAVSRLLDEKRCSALTIHKLAQAALYWSHTGYNGPGLIAEAMKACAPADATLSSRHANYHKLMDVLRAKFTNLAAACCDLEMV